MAVGGSKGEVYEAFAGVVKALANAHRLELVELLAQGERSVEALAGLAGMRVTTTSGHLQSLKRAGLVRTRRQGTSVFYRVAGDAVVEVFVAAKRAGLLHSPELRDAVTAYLDSPGARVPTIDAAAVTSHMTVVDVRPVIEFETGHFPGAVSIPLEDLPQRYGELDPQADVIMYCRGEFCRMAREAAAFLRERGLNARAMDEGVVEWRAGECGLDRSA